MKKFFHWCSRGLTADLLFANEQEFIAGMNRIAVCYLYCLKKGYGLPPSLKKNSIAGISNWQGRSG